MRDQGGSGKEHGRINTAVNGILKCDHFVLWFLLLLWLLLLQDGNTCRGIGVVVLGGL